MISLRFIVGITLVLILGVATPARSALVLTTNATRTAPGAASYVTFAPATFTEIEFTGEVTYSITGVGNQQQLLLNYNRWVGFKSGAFDFAVNGDNNNDIIMLNPLGEWYYSAPELRGSQELGIGTYQAVCSSDFENAANTAQSDADRDEVEFYVVQI